MCKHKKIKIWGLEANEDKYMCFLYAKDFRNLKSLARKSHIHIRILEKHGISFVLFRYRKRKFFQIGIVGALFLILGLTQFIWKIEIEGNYSITSEVLYEYLESKSIYHGMSVFRVDCEDICTMLRKDFTEIIWVSASLEGTKLKITVRENMDIFVIQSQDGYQDIISDMDGTVLSIITRKGIPMVQEGDIVKQGDVLVSGVLELKNDAGEIVREEKVNADADIWIKRTITYEKTCPDIHIEKEYFKTKKKKLSIAVFPYAMEVGIDKKTGNQEITTEYYQYKLNEHFELPIYFVEKISREYEKTELKYTPDEQKKYLLEQYEAYKKSLLEQGIEILSEEVAFHKESDCMKYKGNIEVIQQVVDLY